MLGRAAHGEGGAFNGQVYLMHGVTGEGGDLASTLPGYVVTKWRGMGPFVASIESGMVYTEMGTFFGRYCREWHCYGRPLRFHMHAQHL